MNRQQQIEQMAKVIETTEQIARDAYVGYPSPTMTATDLYDAGYRKQSEGEWEVCSDEYEIRDNEFVCSNCQESFSAEMADEEFFELMKFCPNCGARMKGESK